MATGFTLTLNSNYLPTIPLGITGTAYAATGGFVDGVYTGGTGFTGSPTGGSWYIWTVNANTINPAGPTGYTGTSVGTLTIAGNMQVLGTLTAANALTNSVAQLYLLASGTGPGTGATGSSGDKLIFATGTTGTFPVSIGNSGTTLYQSVPLGGALATYISGTGASYINQSTIAIGVGAGAGALGPTGTIAIGTNAGTTPSVVASVGAYDQIAIGGYAAYQNQSALAVAIGYAAAGYTGLTGGVVGAATGFTGFIGGQGVASIAIGTQAGYENDVQFGAPTYSQDVFNSGAQLGNAAISQVGTANVIIPSFGTNAYFLSQNGGVSFSYLFGSTGTTSGATGGFSNAVIGATGGNATPFLMLGVTGSYPAYATSLTSTLTNVTSGGTTGATYLASSSLLNTILYTNNAGVAYWTYNATPTTTAPVFTTLSTANFSGGALPSGLTVCAISPNVTTTVGYALLSSPTTIYYSSNVSLTAVGSVLFATAPGLPPICTAPTTWSAFAISQTGLYMLAVNNAGNVYFSSNGTAGSANVTFALLGVNTTAAGMGNALVSATMSYNGQMIAIASPSTIQVSYNYGQSWSTSVAPVSVFAPSTEPPISFVIKSVTISGDGTRLFVVGNTSTTASFAVYYSLQTSSYTIAIGNQAGQINQGANAIAVGSQAGQYIQGANAVAIGAGAGQTNQGQQSVALGAGAGALIDTFQYAAPSANNMQVLGFGTSTLGVFFPFNYINSAISSNGQYQLGPAYNNAFYYLSSNYGANFTIYTMTSNLACSWCASDQTGQYMIIGVTNGTITPYYSTNYGLTFSSMGSYPATTLANQQTICASQNMFTIFTASYAATSIIWYTYNATGSATNVPTFTQLSTGGANQLPNQYLVTSNMSGNGTSLIVSMSSATVASSSLVAATSTLYYSATTGSISGTSYGSIQFNLIPTTSGLPASLANCFWSYMAMSQTGQYILVVGGILRSSGTGTGMGVYLSRNGATGTTPTAFGSLVFTQIPTASLPATYHYTTCAVSNSGSTMVVFGTPAPYTAAAVLTGFVSYDYGNTWTTAANSLTTTSTVGTYATPQALANTGISLSGDGTRLLLPAYPIGALNWATTNPLPIPAYFPVVSPNGQNVMVFGQGSTMYYLSCNGGTTTTAITPISTVASLSIAVGSTYNATTGLYYYLFLPYSAGNTSLSIGGSAYYAAINAAGVQSTAATIVSSIPAIIGATYQFSSVAANITLANILVGSGNNTGAIGNVWWAYNATPTAAPSFIVLSLSNGAIFSSGGNYGQFAMSSIVTPGSGVALITYNNGANLSQIWYTATAHTTVATGPVFTALSSINGLPTLTTPTSVYFSSCAVSGNGAIMLVGVYNGGVYLAASAAAVVFSLVTSLPTSTWTYATMSTNAQFMCVANANPATNAVVSLTTATLVVSYTAGTVWVPLTLPTGYGNTLGNRPTMSADGSRLVLAANTGVYTYSLVSFVSQNTVAIGATAGGLDQGANAVAIGANAGQSFQGSGAVALGVGVGASAQGVNAVAIGAGGVGVTGSAVAAFGQGANAIAIGFNTAIGIFGITGFTGFTGSAPTTQGRNAIAIGYNVSAVAQGPGAMAIGYQAGGTFQGAGAIAIGTQAAGGTGYAAVGGTGTAVNNVGATGATLNYIQYVQGATGATGTMSSLSAAPNIAGVTGGQGVNSIAIGVGAGLQNDNSSIIPASYTVTALSGLATTPWACCISYTGQYMAYFSVETRSTFYISNNYGQNNFTPIALPAPAGYCCMSSSGQYIFIGSATANTFIWSTNYGLSFNTSTAYSVVKAVFCSGNGQYLWFFGDPNYGSNTIYYSTSGTSSVPVITACSGLFGLPSGSTQFSNRNGISFSGQYAVFPLYTAISSVYYVYYTSTGTATTPSFASIPTTAGIPSNIQWNGSAMSGTGQYILLIQNAAPSNVFLCSNGTAGVNALSFTQLSLPVTNTTVGWSGCAISYTGQYMFLSQLGTSAANTYVSYNYGINWQIILNQGISIYGNISISGNGMYAIMAQFSGASYWVFSLSAMSSANNVAIGTGAGSVNQSGTAIAIGAGAGLTNQPNSAIAIGVGAGAQNDTMIYNGALAIPIVSASATSGYARAGVSANGQIIVFAGANTAFWAYSQNGGSTFTNTSATANNVFLLSANGQYAMVIPYGGGYGSYSSNMNATPTLTAFTISVGYGQPNSLIGGNSASFQYIMIITNGIWWCSNGNNGTAGNILFTNLTASPNGIANPISTSTISTLSMNMAPNSTVDGQYCIYSVNPTSTTSYLYFSTNTNASTVASIRFGQIQTTSGIPLLAPTSSSFGWSGTAISSNGNYILVTHNVNYEGSVYLSSNGTSSIIGGSGSTYTVSGITFTPITSLPYNNWTSAAMSYSGQYMAVAGQGNGSTIVTIYVSYNYGATWSLISFISQLASLANCNGVVLSGDGSRMIAMTGAATYSNTFSGYIWMLNANTTANAVAIGYQAGQYNQAPNTIAIGFQAGQTLQGFGGAAGTAAFFSQTQSVSGAIAIGFQAGRYGQGANAIALGFQAGVQYFNNLQPAGSFTIAPTSVRNQNFSQTVSGQLVYGSGSGEISYNTAKTFVIDHPTDPARYLVHACVEGPEAGVYYRGAGSRPRATDVEGFVAFDIALPEYAHHIATDFSVEITGITTDPANINPGKYVATPVVDGKFTVYGPAGYDFHWMVHGRRVAIDVEPARDAVELHGTAPYLYVTAVPQNTV